MVLHAQNKKISKETGIMTNKKFVLTHNPTLEFNCSRIEITEFGILLWNDSNELIMPPISLCHEKQMWATLRNKLSYEMQQQLLKKLES